MDGRNDRTAGAKRIRDIGYTTGELSETERDLIRAVEELGADKDVTVRLTRIISRKFAYARKIVHAQEWLEREGLIEIVGRKVND